MQRPPGDFGAVLRRPPLAAPAGSAADYPEDWGPFDVSPPEGATSDAPLGVFTDWEPAELLRLPPAASAGPQAADYPEDWVPLEEASPAPAAPPAAQLGAFADWGPACEFEEHDIWAALIPPPPAGAARSRTVRRGLFPRRDPRHAGPHFLHAGGGAEICRQFNRGRCGGQVHVRPPQSARLFSVRRRRTRCHRVHDS